MKLLIRIMVLLAGLGTLLSATGWPTGLGSTIAATSIGLCLASVMAAHVSWQRPVSDWMAWAALGALLLALGNAPETVSGALRTTVGVVASAAALHVPPTSAPRLMMGSSAATWAIVGTTAFLVAWWPVLSQRSTVVVHDPISSAGIALRMAVAATIVAAVAMVLLIASGAKVKDAGRKAVETQ